MLKALFIIFTDKKDILLMILILSKNYVVQIFYFIDLYDSKLAKVH